MVKGPMRSHAQDKRGLIEFLEFNLPEHIEVVRIDTELKSPNDVATKCKITVEYFVLNRAGHK